MMLLSMLNNTSLSSKSSLDLDIFPKTALETDPDYEMPFGGIFCR